MNLRTCSEERTHGDKEISMRISFDKEEKNFTNSVSGCGPMTGKFRTNFCGRKHTQNISLKARARFETELSPNSFKVTLLPLESSARHATELYLSPPLRDEVYREEWVPVHNLMAPIHFDPVMK